MFRKWKLTHSLREKPQFLFVTLLLQSSEDTSRIAGTFTDTWCLLLPYQLRVTLRPLKEQTYFLSLDRWITKSLRHYPSFLTIKNTITKKYQKRKVAEAENNYIRQPGIHNVQISKNNYRLP